MLAPVSVGWRGLWSVKRVSFKLRDVEAGNAGRFRDGVFGMHLSLSECPFPLANRPDQRSVLGYTVLVKAAQKVLLGQVK